MARIETNLKDVEEARPVPAGKKYGLTISEAVFREEKPDIRVSIGIDDHLDAPNVTHFISLPKADDGEDKVRFKNLMLKRFLVAFDIAHDEDGFDVDDFAGAQAELELGLSDPDESGNTYNRLRLPRLPNEEASETETAPARGKAAAAPARAATRGRTPPPAARRR